MNFPYRSSLPLTLIALALLLNGCGSHKSKPNLTARERKAERAQAKKRRPSKQIKEMNIEEAVAAADFYAEQNSQDLFILVCNHIMSSSADPDIVARYGMKLADLHFGNGNFAEAKKQYKKIITLYPGSPIIERARFREIMAHFWSALSPARDQMPTRTTISLGNAYLKDFPDGPGAEQVKGMIGASYKKLLVSELLVLRFYLNKYDYQKTLASLQAAEQRLHGISNSLLPKLSQLLPDAAPLIEQISIPEELVGNESTPEEQAQAARLLEEKLALLEQFVEGTPATPAANKRPARDMF